MRITGELILMAAAALCVASCAKDTEKLLGGDGVSLQVTAVMDDGTKAGLDDTNFMENDQIGLFMTGYDGKYRNVKATGTGSASAPAVTRWTLGQDVLLAKESAIVAAYYPYDEKADFSYDAEYNDFYINVNVADQKNYLRGYAKEVNESNPKADITFLHAMARLRLKVSYSDEKCYLKEIRLSEVVCQGRIYLISGKIVPIVPSTGVNTVLSITHAEEMPLASEGIYDVLLLPQSATTATLSLTFSDGKSYDTSVNLPAMSSGDYNILPITIKEASTPATDEHDYVDLGLSSGTLWATCNVGATSPEEYGNYYAWGETTTKSSYTSSNYGYSNNYPTTLPLDRDAARANWGGSWCMPTKADFEELRNECTWTWTTMNGKNGYKVSSRKNSSYIFLAAAGSFSSSLYNAGSDGHYWSSSLYPSETSFAYELGFHSSSVYPSLQYRYYGRSVRPVLRK